MKQFGLIGYPLEHSFSLKYFTKKFKDEGVSDSSYRLFSIESLNEFQELVGNQAELKGLNVTIPYKVDIIPFLDELDDEAREIGAVNTIKIFREGGQVRLKGFNTDLFGFRETLKLLLKPHHKKALILGTGGASKAVAYGLKQLEVEYKYVSRKPEPNQFSYGEIDEKVLQEYKIIINTTPLGMYPNVDTCPNLRYNQLSDQHLLYDLVYNPEETLFMMSGKQNGAQVFNGLKMLYMQADKAWEIWNS